MMTMTMMRMMMMMMMGTSSRYKSHPVTLRTRQRIRAVPNKEVF